MLCVVRRSDATHSGSVSLLVIKFYSSNVKFVGSDLAKGNIALLKDKERERDVPSC